MAYGEIKVDSITFTANGSDTTVSVSGLVQNPTFSGDITVTGTISGDIVQGGTLVSGATVSGTAGEFGTITGNTAGFTTVTGTTVTGTTVNAVSGVFTTQISGATVTGNTGQFTNITGGAAGFISVTGTTVTGTTANFTSGVFTTQLSGTTITGNTGQFSTLTGDTAGFTTVTGTTVTGTTANFTSGVFTTQLSGTTITGNTGQFSTLTGDTAGFTTVTGTTVTGTTANFVTVSGTTVTGGNGNFTAIATTTANVTSGVFASGTAAAPSVSVGTTDNGIYSPGTDQVAISTSGTEQIRVDGSGRVLIGTTTEGQADADNFTVADSGNCGITIRSGTANNGAIYFSDGISGTDEYRGYILYEQNTDVMRFGLNAFERLRITSESRIGIGTSLPTTQFDLRGFSGGALASFIGISANSYIAVSDNNYANNVNFGAINSGDCYIYSQSGKSTLIYSGGSERMRIDSSGRLLVGTSSSSATGTIFAQGSSASATGPSYLYLQRGQVAGASISTGTSLGIINFGDSASAVFAQIAAEGDAPSGAGDYPGRLVFSTTADGASSPTERMRITSTGQMRLAGAGITFNGDTAAANELDDYEEGTWTPSYLTDVGDPAYTITSTGAVYTKIGRVVVLRWYAVITGYTGVNGGNLRVRGLPFNPVSTEFIIGRGGRVGTASSPDPRTNSSQFDVVGTNYTPTDLFLKGLDTPSLVDKRSFFTVVYRV